MAKECRYTMHVYDMTMADAIDKLYKEGRYHYKNDLLLDLITIGLSVMTKKEKKRGLPLLTKTRKRTNRPIRTKSLPKSRNF